MAPEDPPRHSRSPDEPVIIEGTAERLEPAEPAAAPQDAQASAGIEPQASGEGSHEGPHESKDDEPAVAETAQSETIHADAAERTAAAEASSSSSATWSQTAPPAGTVVKQTLTSSLIAAGIFGGLVALAAAGAMQYAGYLPGTNPEKTQGTTVTSADIDALRQEIAALKSAAPAKAATDPALEQRLAALEGKIAPLEQDLEKTRGDLSTLDRNAANGADVTARLDAVEKKLDEPQNDGAVARTIALGALRAAADRGGAFGPELDALASVSQDKAAIEALRPFASGDLVSRTSLVEQFPDVAFAMIDAANQPGPDSGIGDRLLASALSIVKVRNVGDVEGAGVDAVTARIEDRLKKGDLKAAAAEWNALPEAAKSAGAAFKAKLDARIRTDDLLSAVAAATNKQS